MVEWRRKKSRWFSGGVRRRLNKPLVSLGVPVTAFQRVKSLECSRVQFVSASGHCRVTPFVTAKMLSRGAGCRGTC